MNENIVVGLDIGTTKIAAIIAELTDRGMKLLGVGKYPSVGLKRGMVVNIELTVESIRKAMEDAERMAGVTVKEVYVGIAGDHVRGINSHAVVAVGREDHEITSDDVRRVIDAAKAVTMPMDREIIHVIPQEFIVDNQEGIRNPIGLTGMRLEVECHIVTGAVASAQNTYRCVERAGYVVKDLVLQPLASSYAVLDPEEQELGVALVDIGGGTTDIAVFFDGSIRQTDMISLAGQNVTNDVSICLRMAYDRAEEIKTLYGCAYASMVSDSEMINIPMVGGRPPRDVPRKYLAQIIEARMTEILNLVHYQLSQSNLIKVLNAGVVFTGGGSLMPGTEELAADIFKMPVRIGKPGGLGGLMGEAQSPVFATGVGLIHYSHMKNKNRPAKPKKEETRSPVKENDTDEIDTQRLSDNPTEKEERELYKKVKTKMKDWLREFF